MNKDQRRHFFIFLGPALFLISIFLLPKSIFVTLASRSAIGTVAWMATWWITAPIAFAVTAFLPIAINAFIKMTDMSVVIGNYASETIILLLGASILTVSWEETGLDQRIASRFLCIIGSDLRQQIVFWFLLSAFLSSVLPNAVVCATVTPIAVSMLKYVGHGDIAKSDKGSLILLTIVYAAGVGGLASPLGGAMNLVTVDYIQQMTGKEYIYISWIAKFAPIMIVLIISNIIYLCSCCKSGDELGGSKEYFAKEYLKMGKMKMAEKWSLLLFVSATVLSFTRQLYQSYLPGLKPAYVFLICAIISFLIKKEDGKRLMIWNSVQKKIIWELIYIFAGGLAAGTIINKSGAAKEIGTMVANLGLTGGIVTVAVIIMLTLLLSDVTSNTATAAVAIPIVISIINGIKLNPIPYIYIASIGVNLSYMLPTSIRAIPVGYGLQPSYMLKKGIPITLIVCILMTIVGYLMLHYWSFFSIA